MCVHSRRDFKADNCVTWFPVTILVHNNLNEFHDKVKYKAMVSEDCDGGGTMLSSYLENVRNV